MDGLRAACANEAPSLRWCEGGRGAWTCSCGDGGTSVFEPRAEEGFVLARARPVPEHGPLVVDGEATWVEVCADLEPALAAWGRPLTLTPDGVVAGLHPFFGFVCADPSSSPSGVSVAG